MKATASRAIASTDVGVLPPDAPMPWLLKTMTRRLVAMPSTTRGSHLSSSAARWLRKITGTPVSGPSCRYTNFVPPTPMRLVGAFLHATLEPECACACMVILPSKGIVAELTDKPGPARVAALPSFPSVPWNAEWPALSSLPQSVVDRDVDYLAWTAVMG